MTPTPNEQADEELTPLDYYMKRLEIEMGDGGGATFDDLYDLAFAIRETITLPQATTKREEKK